MPDFHIPDHVGREAVRLLNETDGTPYSWPEDRASRGLRTVAKLLMNPPAPMTDPDEEAAKRVITAWYGVDTYRTPLGPESHLTRAAEQIRKEFAARKEAWEAGR